MSRKLIMPPATVREEIEQWREHTALPESDAFGGMIKAVALGPGPDVSWMKKKPRDPNRDLPASDLFAEQIKAQYLGEHGIRIEGKRKPKPVDDLPESDWIATQVAAIYWGNRKEEPQ
jgi:hypothetical protein